MPAAKHGGTADATARCGGSRTILDGDADGRVAARADCRTVVTDLGLRPAANSDDATAAPSAHVQIDTSGQIVLRLTEKAIGPANALDLADDAARTPLHVRIPADAAIQPGLIRLSDTAEARENDGEQGDLHLLFHALSFLRF